MEDGKTVKACSRFGHERKARWPVGPKARAARLSQHGKGGRILILLRSLSFEGQVLDVGLGSHTKARRHEGGKMEGFLKAGRRGRLRHGGALNGEE